MDPYVLIRLKKKSNNNKINKIEYSVMTLHIYQTELVITLNFILPLNVHIRIFIYDIF